MQTGNSAFDRYPSTALAYLSISLLTRIAPSLRGPTATLRFYIAGEDRFPVSNGLCSRLEWWFSSVVYLVPVELLENVLKDSVIDMIGPTVCVLLAFLFLCCPVLSCPSKAISVINSVEV